MTHRSRSGGPTRTKKGKGGKRVPKLHHPPAHNAAGKPAEGDNSDDNNSADEHENDIEEEAPRDTVPPASAFKQPTDADVLLALRNALHAALTSDTFEADVQTVKGLLFERKWLELFTDAKLLDAYAGRWAPSRALAFREMMGGLREVRGLFVEESEGGAEEEGGEEEAEEAEDDTHEDEGANGHAANGNGTTESDAEDDAATVTAADTATTPPATRRILSIGGGAGSESLAIAALAAGARKIAATTPGYTATPVHWVGADIGAWGPVLDKVDAAARDRWDLDGASFEFVECDVLKAGAPVQPATAATNGKGNDDANTTPPPPAFLAHSPDLTTIFFTLTELLSQSRARTLALLKELTANTRSGSLLLVADSASDIAQFPLGKDGRTWPVYMVLDALLSATGPVKGWERVRKEDSRWYRLEGGVGSGWPVKLENARYWMRMYRRV